MSEPRLSFNPKETLEQRQWAKITLVFAQGGGVKNGRRWVKYPIKVNDSKATYSWFLNPEYKAEGNLIDLLGDIQWKAEEPVLDPKGFPTPVEGWIGLKPGHSFELMWDSIMNKETKKANTHYFIRYQDKEFDTLTGAKESGVNPLLKGKATTPTATQAPKVSPLAREPETAEPEKQELSPAEAGAKQLGEVIRCVIKELRAIAEENNGDPEGWLQLYSHQHVSTIMIQIGKR